MQSKLDEQQQFKKDTKMMKKYKMVKFFGKNWLLLSVSCKPFLVEIHNVIFQCVANTLVKTFYILLQKMVLWAWKECVLVYTLFDSALSVFLFPT